MCNVTSKCEVEKDRKKERKKGMKGDGERRRKERMGNMRGKGMRNISEKLKLLLHSVSKAAIMRENC